MIPIYICDDDAYIRKAIKEELEKEIMIRGYDMEVVCAEGKPENLLKYICAHKSRGIYFLDVELKGASMDGFLLGQEISCLLYTSPAPVPEAHRPYHWPE